MSQRKFIKCLFIAGLLILTGCQRATVDNKQTVAPASLRDVPALKLSFRFEPDVPPPPASNQQTPTEEKNAAVQNDFDANRAQEVLDRTLTSPDKQRILAVYRKVEDLSQDYRLDVYSTDGKLLRKVTPSGMAVRFPDTIVWSPDSKNIAFVAVVRLGQTQVETAPTPPQVNTDVGTIADGANSNVQNTSPAATPEPAKPVLTFRTEQIYVVSSEGVDLKPLTQNEGLIYFYFVWAPDSSALASLAATWREWDTNQKIADQRGEIFIPSGRPRLVEKNGRIRILDDNVTAVQPVWSPDSSKVALGFDKDVRVYDATGDTPTQAAIPLRNPLLISSKAFDDELRRKESANSNAGASENANSNANKSANANTNANTSANTNAPASTDVNALPDENMLVSFNPIIELEWTEDKMLYVETGFVREYKNTAENRHSYLRWHRLIFSPQATN